MTIEKLTVFAETGDKNTDGLDLKKGFPSKLQPARQWHNWLFNQLSKKINDVIDSLTLINQGKVSYDDVIDNLTTESAELPLSANMGKKLSDEKINTTSIVDNLNTADPDLPLSANMGKKLNDEKINITSIVDNLDSEDPELPLSANMGKKLNKDKLNKADLASGSAPVFAARAWINFNGQTGDIRGSGNIFSVERKGVGLYTVTFKIEMPHANYALLPGYSNQNAGANLGIVKMEKGSFTVQAYYGGDNTVGPFDPLICTLTVLC
ncbi:hypothetical protein [Acinetobacter radioresistens]|uniref:hypothetical protein n=1 Tax=Acinetobacter radioresistens TaxID=40216 RepID=UPI000E7152B0|nr:hypothetical protein [Acinetobacter radioresistens]RJL71628.1 hypothetical protein D5055_08255 [Acinetobacter radioresistens]